MRMTSRIDLRFGCPAIPRNRVCRAHYSPKLHACRCPIERECHAPVGRSDEAWEAHKIAMDERAMEWERSKR